MGDPDRAGYRVYYGTSSGSYVQVRGAGLNAGPTATYTVTGLQSGQRYYFAVTAYDAAGNESTYSAEVSKLTQ
ncbi:MAG: fibronectin type III domain-containing protein [Rhodoferax sp.]|nr:fibronectin type III domain-containing protein [Rhodoferax sp.]